METIPNKLKPIFNKYNRLFEQGNECGYKLCRMLTQELNAKGYSIEYGLDAEPYDLMKLPKVTDKRYRISYEYCGYSERMFVLRFCDKYISTHEMKQDAIFAAIQHK